MESASNSCNISHCLIRYIRLKIKIANALYPLANLAARFILAYVFFSSGILKLPAGFLGIGQGDWENTIYLFQTEFSIPLLDPVVSATLSTAVEIISPILLVVGLGTRIAAFAIFVMAIVIQYTYQEKIEHLYWAILSFILVTRGGGLLSTDYLIAKKCQCEIPQS